MKTLSTSRPDPEAHRPDVDVGSPAGAAVRPFLRSSLIAASAILPLALHAQPAAAAPEVDSVEAGPTLSDLEEKIAILERKLELQEEDAARRKEENPVPAAGRDGFSIKSADGDHQLRWRGYVHSDVRAFPDDPENRWANTFLLRRVRPIWEATAFKYYSFRIMVDFAGSAAGLLDAHVDVAYVPELKFRLGKHKAPIGLERLQSAADLFLVERSFATGLVPNRDMGAQVHGDLWNESVSYAVGLFNGVPDLGNRDADSTDHKEWVGRVFAHPFKPGNVEPVRNLGIGFAASYGRSKGDSANSALGGIRSPAQLTVFQHLVRATARPASAPGVTPAVTAENRNQGTVHAFGDKLRLNPQAYWFIGSFGLFGEWISSSQEVRKGTGPVVELTHSAWQATGSYFLTGEQPGFRNPRPRHPLAPNAPGTPGNQGWGALELVARVSGFQADEASFPTYANATASVSEALTYGGGLNWYASRALKVSANYEYTEFTAGGGGAAAAPLDRAPEHVIFTRFQFSL